MPDRLPALEAVAEAARLVNEYRGALVGKADEIDAAILAMKAALARLDATSAAATSTPQTPTDRELQRIYEDTFVARSEIEPMTTRVSECADAGRRALYNAGRAACVARLRERADRIRKSGVTVSFGDPHPSNVLNEAADALESER